MTDSTLSQGDKAQEELSGGRSPSSTCQTIVEDGWFLIPQLGLQEEHVPSGIHRALSCDGEWGKGLRMQPSLGGRGGNVPAQRFLLQETWSVAPLAKRKLPGRPDSSGPEAGGPG